MKKFITSTVFLIIAFQIFGQLNPINNLTFEHWYSFESGCPSYNCFSLYWDEPNVSIIDTLIGYNIYRDSELWRFQDYIGPGCSEIIYNCPDADFFDFSFPFWIKVKVVYNSTQLESTAVDSAQFIGPMTGLERSQKKHEKIYPNPTNGKVYIDIENIIKIIVINNFGEIILHQTKNSSINLNGHSKGIYFLKIISDKGILTEKIALE